MKYYYLVYLPSLKVVLSSTDKSVCEKGYKEIGRDFDEDYKVMTDFEFLELIKSVYLK